MDEPEFWKLIDRLDWRREGDDDRVVEPVVKALARLPQEEIEGFQEILAQKLYAIDGRAWAREIGEGWWGGVAQVSTDEFLYARCTVVANGQAFYEQVLADPNAMPKDIEFESLLSVAATAWERKTGQQESFDPSVSYETFSNAAGWPPAPPEPEVPRSPKQPTSEFRGDTGKHAARRVIRQLVTGDLQDPVLSAHLASTGRVVVMTPGDGVSAPFEDLRKRGAPDWMTRISLWAAPPGNTADRQPTGLVAIIRLERVSPELVSGTLVRVEPEQ